MRCFENDKSSFSVFIEPIFAKISDTAIPTFRKVLAELGFEESKDFEIFKTPFPKLILKATGHEIHFISGDRPQMIIGVEYSHGTIDESGDCKQDVFLNARSRLRCPNAKVRQLLCVGSPQGINWFADTFDSETQEGWKEIGPRRWLNETRNFQRWRLRTDDNPFLPEDYVSILEDTYGHNRNLIRSYRDGIFCPLYEGTAYKTYDPDRHNVDPEPTPLRTIALAWDFNIELVWTALQVIPFMEDGRRVNKYVAIGECKKGADSFDDAILSFIEQFPHFEGYRDTKIEIYGDRSGHAGSHKAPLSDFERIQQELRKFYKNVHLLATKKVAPEIGSVEAVNKAFSYDRLLIGNNCKELQRSLMSTTWQEGKRKLHKPAGDTWTHRADGLKYYIYQAEVLDRLKETKRVYGTNF